jgi:hypothetical protein
MARDSRGSHRPTWARHIVVGLGRSCRRSSRAERRSRGLRSCIPAIDGQLSVGSRHALDCCFYWFVHESRLGSRKMAQAVAPPEGMRSSSSASLIEPRASGGMSVSERKTEIGVWIFPDHANVWQFCQLSRLRQTSHLEADCRCGHASAAAATLEATRCSTNAPAFAGLLTA